jgi:hypothetical protein
MRGAAVRSATARVLYHLVIALRFFCAVVLAGSAVACHSDTTPDLSRLYASGMEEARTPPVILIPGALGSRLFDEHKRSEVWPGSMLQLLAGSKQDLALPFDAVTLQPIDDGLKAGGLFEEILNADLYGAIVRTLRESGGGSFRGNSVRTSIQKCASSMSSPTTGDRTTSRRRSVSMR